MEVNPSRPSRLLGDVTGEAGVAGEIWRARAFGGGWLVQFIAPVCAACHWCVVEPGRRASHRLQLVSPGPGSASLPKGLSYLGRRGYLCALCNIFSGWFL